MPSSPRGWFCKAIYTLDAQGRTFSPSFEYTGRSDPRCRFSREESLSIKIIAERASRECTRNGVGYELMVRFYLGEAPWCSLSTPEQDVLRRVIRVFARKLREAGFLPDPKDGEEVDRGL